jgi:hypothetical protein
MSKTESIQILAKHVIQTLPDSHSARKQLLEATRDALPQDDDLRDDAGLLLHLIQQQDALQAELTLSYSTKETV